MTAIAHTLRFKTLGRFTYLQWLIILFLFLAAIYAAKWAVDEAFKPAPELNTGSFEGYFDGNNYWLQKAGTASWAQNRNCYNNSRVIVWGNVTYSNGAQDDFSQDGREISGLLCLKTVDSYTWISSDAGGRTHITFDFISARIGPPPYIDMSGWPPWILSLLLLGVIVSMAYKKKMMPEFTVDTAKEWFHKYVRSHGYTPCGPMEAVDAEVVGGKAFTIAQPIRMALKVKTLIITLDSHKRKLNEWWDETGEIYREKFGKNALKFSMELMKGQKLYSGADVHETARDMLEEYLEKHKKPEAKTKEQKEEDVRDKMYKDRSLNLPQYDKDGNIIN